MKIYTYHENINFKKQSELIELWKMSWAGFGFKPIVLDISSAASHPYYNEFVEKLKDIHLKIMQMPIKPYGLSCYVRWLAYANQPDEKFYVSDYDMISTGLKLPEPDDTLHLMDGDCPCIASGRPFQFEKLCRLFVETSYNNLNNLIGKIRPHYHDQEFFVYNKNLKEIKITRTRPEIGSELDDNCFDCNLNKIIHVSHYCVSKIIKNQNYQNTNIDDLRVLLTKKLLRL